MFSISLNKSRGFKKSKTFEIDNVNQTQQWLNMSSSIYLSYTYTPDSFRFGFFVFKWHIKLRVLFNVKAIHVQEL